jgi:hypothetical protein
MHTLNVTFARHKAKGHTLHRLRKVSLDGKIDGKIDGKCLGVQNSATIQLAVNINECLDCVYDNDKLNRCINSEKVCDSKVTFYSYKGSFLCYVLYR